MEVLSPLVDTGNLGAWEAWEIVGDLWEGVRWETSWKFFFFSLFGGWKTIKKLGGWRFVFGRYVFSV